MSSTLSRLKSFTADELRQIVEASPDAMILVAADGRIAYANTQVQAVFGHAPGELGGQPIERLVPSRFRRTHRKQRNAFVKDPSCRPMGSNLELSGLHKSGREFPAEISLNSIDTDGGRFVIASIRDVTGKQDQVTALRNSERRFETAASCASDLIWEGRPRQGGELHDDDLLVWFGDIDKTLGYVPGEFSHTMGAFLEIVHPEDRKSLAVAFDASFQTGKDFHATYRVLRKDGTYLDWEGHAKALEWETGKPTVWIGVTTDITARRAAERALEESLAELKTLRDRLQAENVYLKHEVADRAHRGEIVGNSDAFRAVLRQVQLVAPTDASVLLLGETGTGKGVIAYEVHRCSRRSNRQFVKVDCGALPPTLIESELFGYEKGAFTGASKRTSGPFELADGGTIFLDEIGNLPQELQVKLLRVLHDGEVQRVGSSVVNRVDVRVIAATNCDLEQLVEKGKFRSDLYYRLAVFPLVVPALRKRREDIPLLTSYFVSRAVTSIRKTIKVIPDEVINALVAYDWPGNVRELRNVVERAMILSRGETLELVSPLRPQRSPHVPAGSTSEKHLAAMERRHIVSVLEQCGGKIKGKGNAAEQLGLKPSTLRSRMKKLEILRPRAWNEAVG